MHRLLLLALLIAVPTWLHAHGAAPHAGKAAAEPLHAVQHAFGIAGRADRVARTVVIDMSDDMRYSLARLHVRRGETVRLVVNNRGSLLHELVLGTDAELRKHAELMKKFPNMEHDEPYMVHVPPGGSAEMVWRFNRAGEFRYGCLIAGHFEAGMTGTVTVR